MEFESPDSLRHINHTSFKKSSFHISVKQLEVGENYRWNLHLRTYWLASSKFPNKQQETEQNTMCHRQAVLSLWRWLWFIISGTIWAANFKIYLQVVHDSKVVWVIDYFSVTVTIRVIKFILQLLLQIIYIFFSYQLFFKSCFKQLHSYVQRTKSEYLSQDCPMLSCGWFWNSEVSQFPTKVK